MSIDRASIQNIYPLTPLQAGMYAHAASAPASDAYVEQWWLRITGRLDADVVEDVWNTLFARHEIFRAVFTPGDGRRPLQVILRERRVECVRKDFTALDPDAQARALADERARDRARGFHLANDPLVRVTLIRVGDAAWELIWTHHHIVLDGWSAAIVQSEFMELYAARVAGRAHTLAPAPGFNAFVKQTGADLDAGFWRTYLHGIDAASQLPTLPVSRGTAMLERSVVALDTAESRAVTAFCRDHQVTLAAFVQAVWAVLLARYTDRDDVVFGWVMSGRRPDVPGVERLVGLLINTLPLVVRLSPDDTFRALVARLHQQSGDLMARQADPLVEIQRASGPAAHITHVVAIENYPVDRERLDTAAADTGFHVTAADNYDRTHYGFDLAVLPSDDRLTFRLSWDATTHSSAMMRRLGEQLRVVVAAVLADADVRPCAMNILPPDQWRDTVIAPNETRAAYPSDATLVDLFDARATAAPDAPALVAAASTGDDAWISYGRLQDWSRRVAAYLRRDRRVPPGAKVAIAAVPSVETIGAMLGILRAGCAYVPIDPRLPDERASFLRRDAGADVYLQADELSAALRADMLDAADADPNALRLSPDDVAYVIYTSGTTGVPKGCEVTHRNVVRLLVNDRFDFDFSDADTWVLAHALSFDFSVWEVFAPLVTGGRLVVPTRDEVKDTDAFRQVLMTWRVSVLNQTPLAFAALAAVELSHAAPRLDAHLRWVIFGGDRLDPSSLRGWTARYPLSSIALVNMYGITETTVHVTFCRVTDAMIAASSPVTPIGRALPETTVYVCDRHGNPQPMGAPGEMCVGGSGVCRGYLGRPALTAERFVPDVFAGVGTLYRSGDLAVRGDDGALSFIGRNDAQVKIRGHRIELGDVEAALRAVSGVSQAVAFVEDGASGPALVACIAGTRSAADVREALTARLPDYAHPAHLLVVDEMPLTSNGKLDRARVRALRAAHALDAATADHEPPIGESEERLAEIWRGVLNIAHVGRRDKFIHLGGDSIKAIQVVARLRAQGFTLDLKDIYQSPTIEALAPLVRARAATGPAAPTLAPFPLAPIQERFFQTHTVDAAHFNHALLLRLSATASTDTVSWRRALQQVVDAHAALRLRFHRTPDGQWRQQAAPPGEAVRFEVVDLRAGGVTLVDDASARQQAFDLLQGPLFAAALYVDAASGERHVLLVAHHLVVDAVSWQVILEDLSAGLAGTPPAPPTDAYNDWIAAVRAPAFQQALSAEWATTDPVSMMPVATDHGPSTDDPLLADAGAYGEAAESLIEWNADDTRDLIRHSTAAYGANAGELLLTAAARALGRWTGAATMSIALEGHGRDAAPTIDVSRTVGWFTALYPVTVPLVAADLGRHLREIKELVRRVPRGGAGYGILRYAPAGPLAPAESETEPQVSFNYLGELQPASATEWYAISSAPIGPAVSPRAPRPFALEIAAIVIDGRLRIGITHPSQQHDGASALRVALDEELRDIVRHCVGRRAEVTPADLTHTRLSLDEFESLFDEH